MTAAGVADDPDDQAADAHAEDLASLHVDEHADPLMMVPMSAGQGDPSALTDRLTGDAIEKIDAGAGLVYAIYHAGADVIRSLPNPVINALVRAQAAYGVGRTGRKGR